jgi:hypothetical protein
LSREEDRSVQVILEDTSVKSGLTLLYAEAPGPAC